MKIKVRCTGYKTTERYFTMGKVYEWVDGKLKSDTGYTYTSLVSGSNPNKWDLSDSYSFAVVRDEPVTTQYKVGDVVTVRDDLHCGTWYKMKDGKTDACVEPQMTTLRGKTVKIKSVTKTGKYLIDCSIFPWTDDMFVDKTEIKTETKTERKFKIT